MRHLDLGTELAASGACFDAAHADGVACASPPAAFELRHNEQLLGRMGVATDLGELQNKLWEAADQLRANSSLKASEYASPVLGLIFLRYADQRFARATELVWPGSAHRPTGPEDYQATGALYLPEESRFETLLNLPEGADIGSQR